MKITKRQLQRIIKEERAKTLNESVADMLDVSKAIAQASIDVATVFEDKMYQLKGEMGPGEISPTWDDEVDSAGNALENAVEDAINAAVQRIEAQLHNGDFYRG